MNKSEIKQLRALAHKLKPIVTVGQHGMKESIGEELDSALTYHQLVKLKINLGDRDARDTLVEQLSKEYNTELIQRIGNTAVLYRRNHDKEDLLKQN